MQYDPKYFAEKRAKLQVKLTKNLKKLAAMAYEYVEENNDIRERLDELGRQEEEYKKQAKESEKKKPLESNNKVEEESKNKQK